MPSCRETFETTPIPAARSGRRSAFGGRKTAKADVAVLDAERLLRRLAVGRTGASQVEAAFDPVRLARLRGFLALAMRAQGRMIALRRSAVPERS